MSNKLQELELKIKVLDLEEKIKVLELKEKIKVLVEAINLIDLALDLNQKSVAQNIIDKTKKDIENE